MENPVIMNRTRRRALAALAVSALATLATPASALAGYALGG